MLLILACAEPDDPTYVPPDRTEGDADTDTDADTDGVSVTVDFTGELATVSGTPIGLDGTARTSPITGSFTWNTGVTDALPDDPQRGSYYHHSGSAFTLTVAGLTVTGTAKAHLEVEDLNPDTFRYEDGPLFDDETERPMKVDGEVVPDLELWFAMSEDVGTTFANDHLPATWPFAELEPHTFSLSDDAGTLLFQLDSITVR